MQIRVLEDSQVEWTGIDSNSFPKEIPILVRFLKGDDFQYYLIVKTTGKKYTFVSLGGDHLIYGNGVVYTELSSYNSLDELFQHGKSMEVLLNSKLHIYTGSVVGKLRE